MLKVKLLRNLFKNYVVATRNYNLLTFIVCLFFTTNYSYSQVEEVKKVVAQLCAPNFHGRGYVNGGDSIAADYIASEFKRVGLENVTPNYFQYFSFPVNTFPGQANFSINGKKLEVGKDVIVDPSSPSYNGTLKYKVIFAADILDVEQIMPKLQKAVASDSINCLAIDLRNVHADTLKLIREFKYELAQFIPVIVVTDQKFTWSVSKKQLKNPIFELQASFIDGSPIQVSLDAVLKKEHRTKNVIGYLPAVKKTNKTIVFTAHYDHLGRLGQDTYFPGANDNASGTAMLIALGNYFKKNPIKYNILFIAFAGEEIGLLGSKHYVENPIHPLKDISFLLNLDIFGSGEDGVTVVNGSIFVEHFDLLTDINEEKQLLKQIKPRGYAANSDHYWFTDLGIPSFFIYTMGPNKHYHDISDTYENLSFSEVNDLTTLLATFIERLETVKVKKKKTKTAASK
jgi:aminopeptidase YwaD